MKKRNRQTVALSPDGVTAVLEALNLRRLKRSVWADFSGLSLATVKRLLKGLPIDISSFNALLKTLDLKVVDSYIQKRTEAFQSPVLSLQYLNEQTTAGYQLGVFMTATFTSDKRDQIEICLRHLNQLLIGGEIIFSEDGLGVTVTGNFSETDRKHIQMTINRLENLFTSHRVTW